MATKLKNLQLTSVDLVRAGANQEADICLFKSATPQEATEAPTEREKNIFKRFLNFLRENPSERQNGLTDTIEKDYTTFEQVKENQENDQKLWKYTDALTCSIRSIQNDHEISCDEKAKLMKETLQQFHDAMTELIGVLSGDSGRYDVIQEVQKYNSFHGADGRFASAPGGGGAVGGISHRTMSNGGISIHVKNGKEPKSGYMCATYTDRSTWLKGDEVTDPEKRTNAIKNFMEKNKDVLSDPDNYLGTWYDTSTGNISLDISRNFKSKAEAVKFASEHNEKAIWDVKNMVEIPTGGTGNNI